MSFNPGGGGIANANDVALNNPANSQLLTYNSSIAKWTNLPAAVSSVAGKTGAVALTAADVGLGNVDNTSDATKNSAAAVLTNKDLTSPTNTFPTFNQNTTGNAATATAASGLATTSTTVAVSGAAAPTSGQVLTATSGTAAAWQTPPASTVASLPAGVALCVIQPVAGWGSNPRPTARTDIVVFFKGATQPTIVSSGTGGMINGIDVWLQTP